MKKTELTELVVRTAEKLGATEAEAYVRKARTMTLEGAEEIEYMKTVESAGLGLRVACGKRLSAYATSILTEKDALQAVEKALRIAKASPEDPEWRHMNDRFGASLASQFFDKTMKDTPYEEIVKQVSQATTTAKECDPRVRIGHTVVLTNIAETMVANSFGQSKTVEESHALFSMRTKAVELGYESSGSQSDQSRFWKGLDIDSVATRSASQAIRTLRAKPIESEKMPVVIRNQVFASMLTIMLANAVNGENVQRGRSPLADRLGEQVAVEDFTLVDDGIMPGGLGTRSFDDEGCPTQRTPVIEKGVCKSFIYDSYTAHRDGRRSTGNGYRPSYAAPPRPGTNNFVLMPRTGSAETMIEETSKGFYVEGTIGEQLSNPVSGNLNATVTHGYLIENGELTDPVKGIVISGNFYDVIREGIQVIGKDLDSAGSSYSPTVKIGELTIAGK